MWLDGNDAPVDGKWTDKVSNFVWTVKDATHEDSYYEFLNPTSGTATKYVYWSGGGASIDLGKHWKIVADVEIADNTQTGQVLDMCSYGTTASGYNGLGVSFHLTYGANINVKRGGNTTTTLNTPSGVTVSLDQSWNRMTLMWVCEPVNDTQSRISAYMGDTLTRYTVDFTTRNWSNFRANSSPYNTLYIGRGFLNTSSNKSPLRFRLYDLKIYKKVEE